MKSVIVLVNLLCLIVSATAVIGGWPKPSELSNEEMLMETGHHNHHYFTQFNFGDSKIWKCTYNNGSGAAVSISYPGPPPQSQPSPPLKPTPKMSPPPPTPSPPPPQPPKTSPPPPKPSSPPPSTPKMSPPTPKPSPPPPTPSPPPPTPSPPPPTLKMSPPPPKPSPPKPSLQPPQIPKKSPPPPKESTPSSPSSPSTRFTDPWGHFFSCYNNMVPSAICKQQMEVSYFTGTFSVSDYCCNLIVNMRHDCTDVVLGFFNDPFFVPLLRYTCHVKY